MSQPIRFLSVEVVLQVHQRMIDEFGGTAEVRDQGLLQSAVSMAQAQFGGEYLHKGLPAMAAAYLYHICCNHPFVDGNKRTALATAELFILVNDGQLNASNDELEDLTMKVADGKLSKAEVTIFLERHVN
ncbi:MAG: type II toxin-antitoxin system death-on-curing family toxin [Planctomycetaceae bacterium]|nr:type II toxin-antitoxin system death-on-curing family toxin [Planctomycetaceae bacterium]